MSLLVDDPVPHLPREAVRVKLAMQKEERDPSLDFTSSSFDALKALHTDPSRLQLPYPTVQPCDNLDAYESSKERPLGLLNYLIRVGANSTIHVGLLKLWIY